MGRAARRRPRPRGRLRPHHRAGRHLQAQRAAAGRPVDVKAVLADLEDCLRAQPPLLDDTIRTPRLTGPALATAVQQARTDFDRRIREQLAFAQTGLEGR